LSFAQQLDIDAAKKSGISGANLARLALTPGKLESLSTGLLQVSISLTIFQLTRMLEVSSSVFMKCLAFWKNDKTYDF